MRVLYKYVSLFHNTTTQVGAEHCIMYICAHFVIFSLLVITYKICMFEHIRKQEHILQFLFFFLSS